MSLFRRCFTVQTVDISNQTKWYKQPNNQTSFKNSEYSKIQSQAAHTYSIHDSDRKLSHFYNQRSPQRYMIPSSSKMSQIQRLRQQNMRMHSLIRKQLLPLRANCDQLLAQNNKKAHIISSLETRLARDNGNKIGFY